MANKSLAKPHDQICVLVTGGAGFIGSHTCVELLNQGYRVVVVDDLSNSSQVALDRVRKITGLAPDDDRLSFYQDNILDREALEHIFQENDIDAIIHFAGFKAVGESVEKPLEYYWNNVAGTLGAVRRGPGARASRTSCSRLQRDRVRRAGLRAHHRGSCPKHEATNPYGETKSMLERVLTDLYMGDNEWNVVLLRYFNPIGAHASGLIGEDPEGHPQQPAALRGAGGRGQAGVRGRVRRRLPHARRHGRARLHPRGGPGARARGGAGLDGRQGGHRRAPSGPGRDHRDEPAEDGSRRGVGVFNLGTGTGSSVLDVVHAFERACGQRAALRDQAAPRGRRRRELRRLREGARGDWAGPPQYDLDRMVRRQLALAVDEPRRLRHGIARLRREGAGESTCPFPL